MDDAAVELLNEIRDGVAGLGEDVRDLSRSVAELEKLLDRLDVGLEEALGSRLDRVEQALDDLRIVTRQFSHDQAMRVSQLEERIRRRYRVVL